jgi:hypothetical protein
MRKKRSETRKAGAAYGRVPRRAGGIECCGCHRTVWGELVSIRLEEGNGRTCLGRAVPFAVDIDAVECPHCGRLTTHSMGLPLDPDAPVLKTFEQFIGGPATDEQKDALRSFVEAFVASPGIRENTPDGDDPLFSLGMDHVCWLFTALHGELGDDWWRHLENAEFELQD